MTMMQRAQEVQLVQSLNEEPLYAQKNQTWLDRGRMDHWQSFLEEREEEPLHVRLPSPFLVPDLFHGHAHEFEVLVQA